MGIYLADLDIRTFLKYKELFPDHDLNLLLSFGNITGDDIQYMQVYRQDMNSLVEDSGTWTANNAKKEERRKSVTLIGYINYLRLYEHYFDHIFNYDIDFSEHGFDTNLYNQLILEREGFSPIPVIHSFHNDEIEYYIDHGYDMVAIGSSQIKHNYEMLKSLVWKLYNEGIKVHLFGTAKFHYIANLPIYSCDTTNWAHSVNRGYVYFWNHRKKTYFNKTDSIFFKDHFLMKYDKNYYLNYKYINDFEEYIYNTFNMTIVDLLGRNRNLNRYIVNVNFFYNLERLIDQIHIANDIRWN